PGGWSRRLRTYPTPRHLSRTVVAFIREGEFRAVITVALHALRTRELLNPMIEVGGVDGAIETSGHAEHGVELPISEAEAAPLGEERAGVRELLDAVDVGDQHVPAGVHRDALVIAELSVAEAEAAPLRDERAGIRELLDPVVEVVDHEDVQVRV